MGEIVEDRPQLLKAIETATGSPIPSALKVATVGLLVALPVLYVLSIGPAARLAHDKVIDWETWSKINYPIVHSVGNSTDPTVTRPVERYIDLWLPDGHSISL